MIKKSRCRWRRDFCYLKPAMQARYPHLYPDENDDRIDSPAVKVLFGVFAAIVITGIFLFSRLQEKNRKKECFAACEADKNTGIYGIVTRIDSPANGSRGLAAVYFYEPGSTVKIYSGAWHTYLNHYLQVGDSVAKAPGYFNFRVFRRGVEIDAVKTADTSCIYFCQ